MLIVIPPPGLDSDPSVVACQEFIGVQMLDDQKEKVIVDRIGNMP